MSSDRPENVLSKRSKIWECVEDIAAKQSLHVKTFGVMTPFLDCFRRRKDMCASKPDPLLLLPNYSRADSSAPNVHTANTGVLRRPEPSMVDKVAREEPRRSEPPATPPPRYLRSRNVTPVNRIARWQLYAPPAKRHATTPKPAEQKVAKKPKRGSQKVTRTPEEPSTEQRCEGPLESRSANPRKLTEKNKKKQQNNKKTQTENVAATLPKRLERKVLGRTRGRTIKTPTKRPEIAPVRVSSEEDSPPLREKVEKADLQPQPAIPPPPVEERNTRPKPQSKRAGRRDKRRGSYSQEAAQQAALCPRLRPRPQKKELFF